MSNDINLLISDLMKTWDKNKYNELIGKLEIENKLIDEIENLINTPISPSNISNININEYRDKINNATLLEDKYLLLKELFSKCKIN
jgi:hypothetical protein